MKKIHKLDENNCEKLSGPDARCGRCEFCLTKSRLFKGCELCERTRIYDKRAYHPWGIVGGDGEVEQEFTDEDVKEDPLKFLKLTSVRLYVEQEVPRLVITPPASYDPATCVTSAEKDKGKRKAKPAKLKTEQAERDAQRLGFHKQHGDCVQPSSPRWGAARDAVHLMAKAAPVTNVFVSGSMYSAWTKYRTCGNKGGEHAHNNVWFTISPDGVRQRCFDEDCRGYRSEPTQITPALRSVLFPSPSAAVQSCAAEAGRGKVVAGDAKVPVLRLAQKVDRLMYRKGRDSIDFLANAKQSWAKKVVFPPSNPSTPCNTVPLNRRTLKGGMRTMYTDLSQCTIAHTVRPPRTRTRDSRQWTPRVKSHAQYLSPTISPTRYILMATVALVGRVIKTKYERGGIAACDLFDSAITETLAITKEVARAYREGRTGQKAEELWRMYYSFDDKDHPCYKALVEEAVREMADVVRAS
eukprot:jgi/Mesvir1/10157/Mv02017-RA.1